MSSGHVTSTLSPLPTGSHVGESTMSPFDQDGERFLFFFAFF